MNYEVSEYFEELTQSTKNLKITSDTPTKSLHASSCVLLGDDFTKFWDADKLTLPQVTKQLLCYEICDNKEVVQEIVYHNPPLASSSVMQAELKSLTQLTSGNSKVVYEAKLELNSSSELQFKPGDAIGLFCENNPDDVSWLIKHLDFGELRNEDSLFILKPQHEHSRNLPSWLVPDKAVSIRFLLTHCCELFIPVTRKIMRLFADYCVNKSSDSITGTKQRTRLLEFSSREGSEMFINLIQKTEMNLMDLLSSFTSCRVPFIRLLEILPRLQPRSYTLINLPEISPNNVQDLRFIFTRVDFKTPINSVDPLGLKRYAFRNHGVATGYLERIGFGFNQPLQVPENQDIKNDIIVYFYLRKNITGFNLPDDLYQPIIMIAAGSGIAPFISFLKQRSKILIQNGHNVGPMWLIFGCRSPYTSLLFPDEITNALELGILHHICLCFSRETITTETEISKMNISPVLINKACFPLNARYVQDCISYHQPNKENLVNKPCEHVEKLLDFVINRKAKIMVCGESKHLAPSVFKAWTNLIARYLSYNDTCNWLDDSELSSNYLEESRKMLEQMRRTSLYQEDVWT